MDVILQVEPMGVRSPFIISGKGGFANGSQSFANTSPGGTAKVGPGSGGTLGSGGASSKPSTGTGISGSKGLGGARAPSVGRR